MTTKEDLRVRKTKRALYDAFVLMLSEQRFEDITINDLCNRAGIRRATFYKHYSDKFEFSTAVVHALRDKFDQMIWNSAKPLGTAEYYVSYAKRIVEFVNENERIVSNLLNSNLIQSIITMIVQQNYEDTKERLATSVKYGMKLSASVEVTAAMFAGGVTQIIYNWLCEGKKKNADELSMEIAELITSCIKDKS